MSRPKRRCQQFDQHGKRCGKMALPCPVRYHGDNEIYDCFADFPVVWVEVYLCSDHAQSVAGKNIESRLKRATPTGGPRA